MTRRTGTTCADCKGRNLQWCPISSLPELIRDWRADGVDPEQIDGARQIVMVFGASSEGFAFLCVDCGNMGGVEMGQF